MDLKFNRKIGALVLAGAVLIGSAIGLLRAPGAGIAAPEPDSTVLSSFVDDRASVLEGSAVAAVAEVRNETRGTLLVLTVPTTGGENVYDYTIETAQNLAREGRLSEETGMLLVLAVEDRDYAFVYGSDLWELDYTYEDLLYEELEPDFAKGRYSEAVVEFCDELSDIVGEEYISESDDSDAVMGFFILLVIVVLIIVVTSRSSRRRRYTGGTTRVFSPFIFTGGSSYRRPPMPPRTYNPPRNTSSGPSGFSGGARSGFSSGSSFGGSSRSSFSGGSRSGFSGSSRSSFGGSSRSSFSGGSRGGFSGGSRGGFSGGKR